MLITVFGVLLSFLPAPWGEVASRSDYGEGVWASQFIYCVATKNFPANRFGELYISC